MQKTPAIDVQTQDEQGRGRGRGKDKKQKAQSIDWAFLKEQLPQLN
jgi:hypothetical protein